VRFGDEKLGIRAPMIQGNHLSPRCAPRLFAVPVAGAVGTSAAPPIRFFITQQGAG